MAVTSHSLGGVSPAGDGAVVKMRDAIAHGGLMLIRYPDAFVVCSPVPRGTFVVTDPVIMFEVLSPGTASTDYFEKNREYRAMPSIRRYVILEQTRAAVTVYARNGGSWVADFVSGDAELALPEIGVTVGLAGLCEGVGFLAGETDLRSVCPHP